jgi:hypothetical protein
MPLIATIDRRTRTSPAVHVMFFAIRDMKALLE